MRIPPFDVISIGIVFLCWFVFAVRFLLRRRAPRPKEGKRSPRAEIGRYIAFIGYFLAFFLRRRLPSPFLPLGPFWDYALAAAAPLIAVASVWLDLSAIHHLGRQWSPAARLIEGHELVTTGPYGIVRNPIYTAMLGLLLATGLAIATPLGLVLAVALNLLGTFLRIQAEEKLLLDRFGKSFEDYRKKVRALIPFVL